MKTEPVMNGNRIPSTSGRAANLGAGVTFGISVVAGSLGSWVENQWNTTVVNWKMAGLVVCGLMTGCGFFVGAIVGMIRRIVIGTVLGAVLVGGCSVGISRTNGSRSGATPLRQRDQRRGRVMRAVPERRFAWAGLLVYFSRATVFFETPRQIRNPSRESEYETLWMPSRTAQRALPGTSK